MILAFLGIAALAVVPAEDAHTWPAGLTRLELSNSAGDLHVKSGGDQIQATWKIHKDQGCELEVTTKGSTAVVAYRSTKKEGGKCEADFTLTLPATVSLAVELGAGDVSLDDLVGDATVSLGAGDLTVQGGRRLEASLGAGAVSGSTAGPVAVSVGAGDVDLDGLTAPAEVSTGTGAIELDFRTAPIGRIEASSGVGSVDIGLPSGTAVRGDLPDEARRGLKIDPGATTEVDLSCGMGQVTVRA